MISAKFSALQKEPSDIENFLSDVNLSVQLFDFAAEAVCTVVHGENENYDVADLVLGGRNNAAFRTLAQMGADYGIFQIRSKGGKSYIANQDKTLRIMVHNTDKATALGAHVPAFASKRRRHGTSYIHSEAQGEFEFGDEVVELEKPNVCVQVTTIDACIFAEKIDGNIDCRIELLIGAELTERGDAFQSCEKRFGIIYKSSDFAPLNEQYDSGDEDFSRYISPKQGN